MGLIHTESWQRFPLNQAMVNNSSTGAALAAATNFFLTEKEYVTRLASSSQPITTSNQANTYTRRTVVTVADPVEPDKQRLQWPGNNSVAIQSSNENSIVELTYNFGQERTHYIVGFLVRAVAGSQKTQNPSTYADSVQALSIAPPLAERYSNSTTYLAYVMPQQTHNIMTMHTSAQGGVAPTMLQSIFTVKPTWNFGFTIPSIPVPSEYDTDYFIEIEVDTVNKVLNIWKDDVLVAQPVWRDNPYNNLRNGISFWMASAVNTTGYQYGHIYGAIQLSDIYIIDCNDGVAPTTRLGSSTRVRGEAPNVDVDIDFTRPDGYASNAAVVAQNVTPGNPAVFLQADGDNATDIYKTDSSNIGQYAGKIYGVTVRTRSANASVSPHNMAIITKDATTENETDIGQFGPTDGFKSGKVVLAKDPSGNEWTVPNAANLQYGLRVKE